MHGFFIFSVIIFLSVSNIARANCQNPLADAGTIIFNNTHNVFQGCTKTGKWMAFHGAADGASPMNEDCTLDGQDVAHGTAHIFYNAQTHANCASVSLSRNCENGVLDGDESYVYANCTAPLPDPCETGNVGTPCDDGSFYVGALDGGPRLYVAVADESDMLQWKTSNTSTPYTNNTDGYANTYNRLNNVIHPAARACATKVPAGTWYLPAKDELNLIWINKDSINLPAKGISILGNAYRTSSEADTYFAWVQRFHNGEQGSSYAKDVGHTVRCFRH